jgi:hypothetical protein
MGTWGLWPSSHLDNIALASEHPGLDSNYKTYCLKAYV